MALKHLIKLGETVEETTSSESLNNSEHRTKNLETLTIESAEVSNLKVLKETSLGIGKMVGYSLFGINFSPTAIRKYTLSYGDISLGSAAVMFSAIVGTYIESLILSSYFENDYVRLIPFATNIASGFYEYLKYTQSKLRNKQIGNEESSLERVEVKTL